VTPAHITLSRLDRRIWGERWRINPAHPRDPAERLRARTEYMRQIVGHLDDATKALEGTP
jgi:hypothetical protein